MAETTARPALLGRLWHRIGLLARPRRRERLPVRIDRRRIYILPTGFGLFFGAVLLAMLLGALNYNNNPALVLSFLLAAVVHNSFVRAHLNLSGLALTAVHAEPVHAGQPLTLRCGVDPGARRRRVALQLHGSATFDVEAGEPAELRVQLATTTRGWLPLPRMRLRTRHPLGFAEAWCWFWPEHPLLVYPVPEADAPPLPLDGGDGPRAQRDPSGTELHHLRDYRTGDPMRQVAWKSSARADRLLVREAETSAGADVVLDWNALTRLAPEQRIRRLTRWVMDAERSGRRYVLVLPSARLGPEHGAAHRHACLRALALLPHG